MDFLNQKDPWLIVSSPTTQSGDMFADTIKGPFGKISYFRFWEYTLLDLIFVEPEFRGQGYGGKMLQQFIDHNHTKPIVLYVSSQFGSDYDRLVEWYQRFGFQRAGDSPSKMILLPAAPVKEEA
jgi:GNAT superfamily N-acetyltransferase